MSLLITRPRHDRVTHYFFHWSGDIINVARRRKIAVYDLARQKARRNFVESYLRGQAPSIAIFNGHGDDASIGGHNNEILIALNDNESLLNGKDVFMRACGAGKTLGPSIIQNGARSFIGYKDSFVFLSNIDKFNRPLEDEIAKPFMECSNQVGIALVKGHNAGEAHASSLKMQVKVISEKLSSRASDTFLVPFLVWNLRHQVLYI